MHKSAVFLLTALLLTVHDVSLGQFTWFKEFPGSSYTGAEDVSIDPNDNLLVIGNFDDGITIIDTNHSGRGSFLLKLNKDGVYQWHKVIRYAQSDFWHISQVETDGAGNSYIAGTFPQSATIDGTPVTGSPSYNSLIAKFDIAGELIWIRVIPTLQEVFDMKVNKDGYLLLFSRHYGTVTFDNVSLNVGPNAFGMLLTPAGNLQWARTIGNPDQYNTWPKACALDNARNAFFHGIYSGTLTVDEKQIVSSGGNYDFFFAAINSNATCEWLTTAERKLPSVYEPAHPPNGLIIERGALETDGDGNVYAGGTYWEGMKVGNTSLAGSGAFLLKLNRTGAAEWAGRLPGSGTFTTVDDIVVRNNRVYLSGINSSQYYFSLFDPGGERLDFVDLTLSGDIASGLGVDSQDSVYMSGRIYRPPNSQGFVFKYGNSINLPPPENADVIAAPSAFCITDQAITLTTKPIPGADSYEWEIRYNNQIQTLATTEPLVVLPITGLAITANVSVQVRGVNESGKGGISPEILLQAESPLAIPQLSLSCAAIELLSEHGEWQWYRDGIIASEYTEKSIRPYASGVYHVIINNACGQAASEQVSYTPITLADIFIPNIITPNHDGRNEFFIIDERIESPALFIYNRWGQEVYTSRHYTGDWNGNDLPAGVYFYQLQSRCFSNPITGPLTIAK